MRPVLPMLVLLALAPVAALADDPAADGPGKGGPSADEPDEPTEDEPTEDGPDEDEPDEDDPAEDEPDEDDPAKDDPNVHVHDVDPFPDHADDPAIIEVSGDAPPPPTGAGDMRIGVRETQAVHPPDPEGALALTPGLLLTRNGGDGAPMRIFLRGFDARHGQDVAFSLDGLPVNQVGNPHGHGLVDLRLVPAEAVSAIEINPGPTDPAQPDFTVAGSLDMELGLPEPGMLLGGSFGSFNTARAVVGWRHAEQAGTFALGEIYTTDGYGENRGGLRGTGVIRVDRDTWRITAGFAGSRFDHAGLVRKDDVDAGRLDLYGTHDPAQSTTGQHAYVVVHAGESDELGDWEVTGSLWRRSTGIRSNFTGFLTDDRRPGESPHPQRGDLLDQRSLATTAHAEARFRRHLGSRAAPTRFSLDAGLRGRFDDVDAVSLRLRDLDQVPYRTELDLSLRQGDVGLWAAGEVDSGPFRARGGLRAQSFLYEVTDRCAARDRWFPGIEQDDVNCPDEDRNGVRRRDGTRAAAGLGIAPRGALTYQVAPEHQLLASGGRGFRSIEVVSLSEGEDAPFAELWSGDAGWRWQTTDRKLYADHRLVGFVTWVRRDLVFDEDLGANVAAGSSTRIGATATSEVHLGGWRQHTSVTVTHATFGDQLPPAYVQTRADRIPGALVPYVPTVLGRTDHSYTWAVKDLGLRHGLAATFIGPRPLPLSQWADPVLTVDVGTELRWRGIELGAAVTNVLGARFALAEFHYASWFPQESGTEFPTRLPARHVSPGAPRAFMLTLTLHPEAL